MATDIVNTPELRDALMQLFSGGPQPFSQFIC